MDENIAPLHKEEGLCGARREGSEAFQAVGDGLGFHGNLGKGSVSNIGDVGQAHLIPVAKLGVLLQHDHSVVGGGLPHSVFGLHVLGIVGIAVNVFNLENAHRNGDVIAGIEGLAVQLGQLFLQIGKNDDRILVEQLEFILAGIKTASLSAV